jgi:hypothetical protein
MGRSTHEVFSCSEEKARIEAAGGFVQVTTYKLWQRIRSIASCNAVL